MPLLDITDKKYVPGKSDSTFKVASFASFTEVCRTILPKIVEITNVLNVKFSE
jgi:hypothetical protein